MQGTSLYARLSSEGRLGGQQDVATARFGLILLALACVAATLAVAVFLLLYQAAGQRDEIQEDAEGMARSAALAVDGQLGAAEALLTGLAVSPYLDVGALAAFHDQAVRLPKPPGSWIILLDPQGRMLVNTMRAYGALLPEISEESKRVVAAIAESRDTEVSNLTRSLVTGAHGAALGVPVIRDGKVIYVLAIALVGQALTGSLERHGVPAGWSTAILDRMGATVTRYPAAAQSLDAVAGRTLLVEIRRTGREGFETTVGTQGPMFVAHASSEVAGWTTIVAIPSTILAGPMHRAIVLVSGGGGLVLLLAIGIALAAGARMDRPLRAWMKASEERFRFMAETVPDILFTTGPDGQCQYVNQRFYEYTGMRPNSALGFGWTTAIHPEDRARASERFSRGMGDADLVLSEARFRARDGSYRWFLSRLRPVHDRAGRIVKWFGSSTDIDALKQSDTLMRRINERLTAVLASIDECYYTVDHHWRITHVNSRAATYFCEDPALLVGRSLWEVSPHVVGTELERQLRQALDEHKPLHVERMSREYPGRWFQISCYPWAEGLSIFFRDITRRKTAELAARDMQELLQRTMDALSAHIAILDEHGKILGTNAAWQRLDTENGFSGAPHGVGSDFFAIAAALIPDPASYERVATGLRAVLHGEREEFRSEHVIAAKAPRWFQLRASRFGKESAWRVVVAQEDISEIKAAEDGLRQLTGRLLRVQDEERRRMARDLHDTTAQNLVVALLDLDRLRQEAPELDNLADGPFSDMRALIEESLQQIRTLSYLLHPPLLDELGLASALSWYMRGFEGRSGITVALKVQEGMERLPAVVEQALFRVVQEALTNIHRHSGSATAEIRLTRSASDVVLEIADEGRGIAAEADANPDNVATIGVGVSGMRARLQQLGGELTIRGTARGTTVRAAVPLHRPGSIAAAE